MNLEDCVGKTIKQALYYEKHVSVHFTDGEVLLMRASKDRFDENCSLDIIEVQDLTEYDKVRLGFLSEEKYREVQHQRQVEFNAQQRANRLKEWQRLNSEFAGKEPLHPDPDAASGLKGFSQIISKVRTP